MYVGGFMSYSDVIVIELGFTSWQHLRSYQEGLFTYKIISLRLLIGGITYWWRLYSVAINVIHDTITGYFTKLTNLCPDILMLSDRLARLRQVSIWQAFILTRPRIDPMTCRPGSECSPYSTISFHSIQRSPPTLTGAVIIPQMHL